MDDKSKDEFAALIGIDWADKKHDICLLDVDSGAMEFSILAHKPEAIDKWVLELRSRLSGRKVAICLEQKKGPLVYALLKYDFLVLFPVNPQTLAKYRRTFKTSRAKDDPTDAALMVDLLVKHRDKLSAWEPEKEQIRKLQILVEHRRRLVGDKVRVSNRLTSLLKGYYPQVLDWFKDKDTEVFCDFIIRWPTLRKAQRAKKSTIERFLFEHNVRYKNVVQNRLAAIAGALALTDDRAIIESSAIMAVVTAGQLKELLLAIRRFDEEIEDLFDKCDDYDLFSTLPGAGPVLAPRLLVAFGCNREKYDSADDILRYSGIAPVVERSGQKSWVHWRYSCPKFLRQSFVEWAKESTRHSFWAGEFYRCQRDKGKSHQAAVRALAFKWIRILFRCWKDRKPYDEAKYLLALQKKGSPLLAGLRAEN